MAVDCSSHMLNNMVKVVSACHHDSHSSLPKLRELKRIRDASLVDRKPRERGAASNSQVGGAPKARNSGQKFGRKTRSSCAKDCTFRYNM